MTVSNEYWHQISTTIEYLEKKKYYLEIAIRSLKLEQTELGRKMLEDLNKPKEEKDEKKM